MKPSLEEFTVVIVGAWNPAIINPVWLAKNTTIKGSIDLEIGFAPTGTVSRALTQDLVLMPSRERVSIAVRHDCQKWRLSLGVAADIVQNLPHTPITAVGLNFGFTGTEIPEKLADVVKCSDDESLNSTIGASIEAHEITRRLTFSNHTAVNFTIKATTKGPCSLSFNHHVPVQSAAHAQEWLRDDHGDLLDRVHELLKHTYNIDVEYTQGTAGEDSSHG